MTTADTTDPESQRESNAWSIVQAVVAMATGAPFLFVRFPPLTDLPEHVAAIATLARLLPGGGGDPHYVLSLKQSQYILYDLAGAVLTRFLGDANLANRLLLFAVAVCLPYAVRALLRQLGRDPRLGILASMVFWNRALIIGFLPFVASVPLAVMALAILLRQVLSPPTKKGAIALGIVAVLLFYTHVSSYVLFVASGAVMAFVQLRTNWRRSPWVLAPLLPSAICALAWWRAGSLSVQPGERDHVGRLPFSVAIDAAPIWAFDIWRSHTDEIWSALWWIAFGLVLVTGIRRKPEAEDLRRGFFGVIPLLCTAIIYLATPFHVGAAGYLDVRLAPMLAIFALLILRPSGRLAQLSFALGAVAAIGTSATAAFEMRRLEREMVGDFDALLSRMRPDSRLVMLNFEQRSPRSYFFPYVFVGSYHRLKEGATASYSFSELPHWPIHYSARYQPPPHPGWWLYRPCEYRYRMDGAFYDYALVQGALDPFREEHPGPSFRPIARSGVFTLYEKIAAESEEAAERLPDRSPCRRPSAPAQ